MAAFLLALGVFLWLPAVQAQTFDLVILDGRVMDPETGLDAVRNVGIDHGRIARVTKTELSGTQTIDASGQVVTAGFIDAHFHWSRPMGYKLGLRDGLTTAMDLEFGTLGSRVDDWYQQRMGLTQVNFGTSSSHELARSLVLDQAGAIGIGSTLGYMPGVSAEEMFAVQKLAAGYGRQTSVHSRNTPGTATAEVSGAQEVLANAVALGAPVCINHFNNPGWEQVQLLLPGITMASDGMPIPGDWPWTTDYSALPNMHPRGAGARGRSLRLAREEDIPLMQVLAALSFNVAKYLGAAGVTAMQERGRLQEGKIADIVVFDPQTVTDRATYAEGTRPTEGVGWVLVNGVVTVREGRVLADATAGQPIRFVSARPG